MDNLFCEVNENMKAYGVATHRHTPEIEEQLGYACGEKIHDQLHSASGTDEPWDSGNGLCKPEKRCDV